MKVCFIGYGKMASAIAKGLVSAGFCTNRDVIATDVVPAALEAARKDGFATSSSNPEAAPQADILFLATKPQDLEPVLKELAGPAAGKLVISIAAGVRIAKLERFLQGSRVIRVMPNLNAMVGASASAFALGARATREDAATAKRLLDCGGKSMQVPEDLLDAVTGLSGSGPAYIFRFADALIRAGEKQGLPHETAKLLTLQTILGSASTMLQTDKELADLIASVASKGGTTEQGLKVLDEAGFEDIMDKVVEAGTKRSKELSA